MIVIYKCLDQHVFVHKLYYTIERIFDCYFQAGLGSYSVFQIRYLIKFLNIRVKNADLRYLANFEYFIFFKNIIKNKI